MLERHPRETKLVINWHLGKRCTEDTVEFLEDLRYATSGRYQLSTDGFRPYSLCVPHIFNANVDFAQIVKKYGKPTTRTGRGVIPRPR